MFSLNFAAQFTFDAELPDTLAQSLDFSFGQVLDARIGADTRRIQNRLAAGRANAVDIGERHFDALITREVNTFNTCHKIVISSYFGVIKSAGRNSYFSEK